MRVEEFFVLILRKMAQERQEFRLGMDNGMRLDLPRSHLVMVNGQVRIEFTCHPFEWTIRRCKHPSGLAAVIHNDRREVCGWSFGDIAQSPPRASSNKRRACQVRSRSWQLDLFH